MKPNGRACEICGAPLMGVQRIFCSLCAREGYLKTGRRWARNNTRALLAAETDRIIAQRRGVKNRICLSCDGEFLSQGPWNRICPDCASAQRRLGEHNLIYEPRTVRVALEQGRA